MQQNEIIHSRLAASAAMAAAELHAAGKLALALSLTAKNTRTLVLKAGTEALGLKPITEQFSLLADSTMELTRSINEIAIDISKTSVDGWKNDNLCSSLLRAASLTEKAEGMVFIENLAKESTIVSEELAKTFQTMLAQLASRLEEIRLLMRSTDIISVTFKLEATQTGQHEKMLTEMARNINSVADDIKEHVSKAIELFDNDRQIH